MGRMIDLNSESNREPTESTAARPPASSRDGTTGHCKAVFSGIWQSKITGGGARRVLGVLVDRGVVADKTAGCAAAI